MKLLVINEDALDSLAEDLRMKWAQFDFDLKEERIEEELALVLWIMLRLGWKEGFNDCHHEWELDRESSSAIKNAEVRK